MPFDDDRLAAELAEQAGKLLLDLRAEGDEPGDLRKAGDRLSHEFLAAELAARRPGDAVLSEEGKDDPARLAADRVWIVDPLDGTREFGEPGRTDWAVHVALWARNAEGGDGDLIAGAIALPAQNRVLATSLATNGEAAAERLAQPDQETQRPLRMVVSRSRASDLVKAVGARLTAELV